MRRYTMVLPEGEPPGWLIEVLGAVFITLLVLGTIYLVSAA